jgi:hypothetical protein
VSSTSASLFFSRLEEDTSASNSSDSARDASLREATDIIYRKNEWINAIISLLLRQNTNPKEPDTYVVVFVPELPDGKLIECSRVVPAHIMVWVSAMMVSVIVLGGLIALGLLAP